MELNTDKILQSLNEEEIYSFMRNVLFRRFSRRKASISFIN
ncbi:hypothetical protein SAMN05192532_101455 [Alteribacillus iranensis]|uniref:Uncharacterized protein n=1 Tax=Alteribacillus iranensis TaxID=930128 RepID=A0A1I1ZXI2_9BACI|nr:hypothetical protein SAMN05192532_101455 [Alteribacillus iranensis]